MKMHTQTEAVNTDKKAITSDVPGGGVETVLSSDSTIKTTANVKAEHSGGERNIDAREKDSDRYQRYERKKRNQSDSNHSYHSLSPRRHHHNNGGSGNSNRYARLPNHSNGGGGIGNNNRQTNNRNNYVINSKTNHLDANNNNHSNSNGISNGTSNSVNTQSMEQHLPLQQQLQKHPNHGNFGFKTPQQHEGGYQDGKKQQQSVQKSRFITKSATHNGSFDQQTNAIYNDKSLRTMENGNHIGGGGGGEGDSLKQAAHATNEMMSRKYSTEFLKHVGQQYSMNALLSAPGMKNQLLLDEQNLMAIKLAFGDNAHIYNSLGQQNQHQQSFMRYQQQQLQQRMQLYHRHEQAANYQRNQNSSNHRVYTSNSANANATKNESDSSAARHHHTQLQQQQQQKQQQQQQQSNDLRTFHNFYQQSSGLHHQNSLNFQNRVKSQGGGNRDTYRDRKNRNQSNNASGNGGVGGIGNGNSVAPVDRYNNTNGSKKPSNEQRLMVTKSERSTQDEHHMRKNLSYVRSNSEEYKYRSLSPLSLKSSSPGNAKKSQELLKDSNGSNESADDSESTASASSGPSFSSDTSKEYHPLTPPPILLTAITPTTTTTTPTNDVVKVNSVNSWINSNNFGMLHNGLSASAEQLNTRMVETPVTIIRRPPSANEISSDNNSSGRSNNSAHIYSAPRHLSMSIPTYDPAYPFEYYLSRSDISEMRTEPKNLKCNSVWDVLSKQMWEKFQVFQQTRETYRSKMILWRELYECVKEFPLFKRACPKWGLFLVGSTISGFGLDSSDVDMCLVLKAQPQLDPRTEAIMTLSTLNSYLVNSCSSFQGFHLINAKVPILRFRDITNKIEVDLNYNNCIGVRNTHLLHCYSQLDWRLRPLAIIVKLWAQYHNINNARNSTISSYSLVLMVIHFLQYAVTPAVLPCLHKMYPEKFQVLHDIMTIDMMETLDTTWQSENAQPIGELFLRFLDYYSNFNFSRNAISIRTGGLLSVEECKHVKNTKNDPNHWQTLCIEEPFDLTNTARSTYDGEIFEKIKNVFYHSWRRLKEYKTLDALFQNPLFLQQNHNSSQYHSYHQLNAQQMLKYIIYNPNAATQLLSNSPINTEIAS